MMEVIFSDVEVEDVYKVFETYESAKEFAIKEVESNPKIECWIINSENEVVSVMIKMEKEKLTNKFTTTNTYYNGFGQ